MIIILGLGNMAWHVCCSCLPSVKVIFKFARAGNVLDIKDLLTESYCIDWCISDFWDWIRFYHFHLFVILWCLGYKKVFHVSGIPWLKFPLNINDFISDELDYMLLLHVHESHFYFASPYDSLKGWTLICGFGWVSTLAYPTCLGLKTLLYL